MQVFSFPRGRLLKVYDESLEWFTGAQSDPNEARLHLEHFDFGKRVAVEKEMRKSALRRLQCCCFDESSSFQIF